MYIEQNIKALLVKSVERSHRLKIESAFQPSLFKAAGFSCEVSLSDIGNHNTLKYWRRTAASSKSPAFKGL